MRTFQERLREASERALERLQELVESDQLGLALKACDSILDRNAETARTQRLEGNVRGRVTIDPATLMHAALTARELDDAALQAMTKPDVVEPEKPTEEVIEQDGNF